MVTSRELQGSSGSARPRRRGMGGAGVIFVMLSLLAGLLIIGGIGLFEPARLAFAHERALSLLHGGIAATDEQTYVDGCVPIEGLEGFRAITRTHRTVSFNDGTTLQVVFSGKPAPTNACP